MQVDCIGLARIRLGEGYVVFTRKKMLEPPTELLGANPQRKLQIAAEAGVEPGPRSADKLRFELRDRHQIDDLEAWFRSSDPKLQEGSLRRAVRRSFVSAGLEPGNAKSCQVRHYGYGIAVISRVTYLISYWNVGLSATTINKIVTRTALQPPKVWVLTTDMITSSGPTARYIGDFAKLLLDKPSTSA